MQNERSERIWYSVQSEKSVNYTYTYIRMSYYQRSIQNAIQKIKINEVLMIKSQRQSKCEETSLLGDELIGVLFLYNTFLYFLANQLKPIPKTILTFC